MSKVSLSVKSKTSGAKDNSRTLGYINPEATNEQLGQLAGAYTALSTKTYESGEKIVRTDINEPADTRPTPTLTIGNFNFVEGAHYASLNYNGDGRIYYRIKTVQSGPNEDGLLLGYTQDENGNPQNLKLVFQNTTTQTVEVYATETKNYKSITVEKTVTKS